MQRFADLVVWQRSHQLVLDVYRASAPFPSVERFGLASQLRRAAASVPANIAEGSRRKSAADFAHFLNIAEASLGETEYHLILSRDLGYLAADGSERLLAEAREISAMLFRFRRLVEQQSRPLVAKQNLRLRT